jgi:FAD synthetase
MSLDDKIREANCILTRALSLYSPAQLTLSFNGGKDCTVLLHLLSRLLPTTRINGIYFAPTHPFQEVADFMDNCLERYSLHLLTYTGSIKDALTDYCAGAGTACKAIVMGTRDTDPYSSMSVNLISRSLGGIPQDG